MDEKNFSLDGPDRQILDIIQSSFPLTSRPYDAIGEELGMSGEEVYARVRKMRKAGVIRRLGANFQSGKIGFKSTLCAAKVPEEAKADFVERVNSLPNVTHNYERDHQYNVWFTLICESREKEAEILANLREATGIKILSLPASRFYKIKVDFQMA